LTEKELKKLNRYQLLELLIIQTERADELQKKLDEAQALLDSRDVKLTVMGSIAEASLQLGGVFEAAQNAADTYLNAAKERAAAIEEEARKDAERILNEAKQKAAQIL
jgi:cell division septum initiation protein DivIVA